MRLLILLSLAFATATARDIQLNDDFRYVDVLVAIDSGVTENWDIVDQIKESFSRASVHLSTATSLPNRRPLAFGHVHILVPSTWQADNSTETATWEAQDIAHFHVGNGSGLPNTVQPGGCGQPGLRVQMYTQHLADEQANTIGKQLVHEFARLRWGVFNEYNGAAGPHSYLRNGRISPVACSTSIRGKFGHKDTGNPCRVNRTTLELEPDCRFVPEIDQTAAASLMYATYLQSVDQFCSGNTTDTDYQHNSAAPNPHNRRCRRRSVQSVMLDHPDFSRTSDERETDTKVDFTIVQRQAQRELVMVMDVSGSMNGDPLAKLKIAGRSLVMDQLEHNIKCALIKFNHQVEVMHHMQSLNSTSIRTEYWNAIKGLTAGGFTAIGDALAVAMELLGANVYSPTKNDTGYVVLLTDGQSNEHTRFTFEQAIEIAKRTSIVVDTIAFGNAADKRLTDLSRDTGGKSYFVRFSSGANDLLEAMADLVRDRVDASQKPIDVFSSPVTAGFSQTIQVDPSVTNSAVITLSSPTTSQISSADLEIVSPTGKLYSRANTSIYEKDTTNGFITVSIQDDVQSGEWTIKEVGSSSRIRRSVVNSRLTLHVTAKPSGASPIVLDGSVSESKVNVDANTQIKIFATLTEGAEMLTGAAVSASIEADSGDPVAIQLRDDGAGGDSEANDGVYTGIVPSSVIIEQEYNVRIMSSSPVSRVSTAGKFEILDVDVGSLERTPPGNVEDLRAVMNLEEAYVTLIWTAVGDRKMEGEASSYDLLSCESPINLEVGNIDSCLRQQLNVTSLPAGSRQSITLTQQDLPTYNNTFYMTIVAINSRGIESEIVSSVSAQFTMPDNIEEVESGQTTTEETTTTGTTTTEKSSQILRGSLSLVCLVVAVAQIGSW